jgi:hypothetical protein
MAGPVIILIWTRLRRAAARFAALAARVRAGALPSPAPLRPRAASRPARPRPPHRLPGGFAWLVRLAPEAACFGGQLQHLLSDPEFAALLAAAPQMGRVLRPLCRMLGVDPPAPLARSSRSAGSPSRARAPSLIQPGRIPDTPPAEPPERSPGPGREPVRAVRLPASGGLALA